MFQSLLLEMNCNVPDVPLITPFDETPIGVHLRDEIVMTHKYRGSIIVLSISKSVKPNEEQKEMTSDFQEGIMCKH